MKCPLCDAKLNSLFRTKDHEQSGFHYRCPKCGHGWYVADLQRMIMMRLRGRTDDYIRSIILKQDSALLTGEGT